MSCPKVEWLHGYFDGELDAARSEEFEAHLETCAACSTSLAGLQGVRDGIGAAALYAPAPPSLRMRVGDALPPLRPRTLLRSAWLPMAAGAAAMVLLGVWWVAPRKALSPSKPDMVASILDAHLRSLQLEHLTDVASSEQHTVRPWFDGKLDISPPVMDLASEGFPLTGGRLDVVGGRSVAALVYGRRKHVVNLFVAGEEGHEGLARSGTLRGYQWIHWNRAGMSFWAISDVSAGDLEEFAHLLQR